MKKHINFIIIGAAMGIIPFMLLFVNGRWQRGFVFAALGMRIAGPLGSIGGWMGGALSKKNWGAVVGGLVGTISAIVWVFQPQ